MIGIVVGLGAEARIARRLGSHVEIAIGGGTADGARRAAERLLARGASGLISFGLAAGLAPDLAPGTVIVPRRVRVADATFATDSALNAALGGATPHDLLHSERVVVDAADKHRLYLASRCAALDMESGAVARAALAEARPFAVLRAVCDPRQVMAPIDAVPSFNVILGWPPPNGNSLGRSRLLQIASTDSTELPGCCGSNPASCRPSIRSVPGKLTDSRRWEV